MRPQYVCCFLGHKVSGVKPKQIRIQGRQFTLIHLSHKYRIDVKPNAVNKRIQRREIRTQNKPKIELNYSYYYDDDDDAERWRAYSNPKMVVRF